VELARIDPIYYNTTPSGIYCLRILGAVPKQTKIVPKRTKVAKKTCTEIPILRTTSGGGAEKYNRSALIAELGCGLLFLFSDMFPSFDDVDYEFESNIKKTRELSCVLDFYENSIKNDEEEGFKKLIQIIESRNPDLDMENWNMRYFPFLAFLKRS
jgi:hypothetical protein